MIPETALVVGAVLLVVIALVIHKRLLDLPGIFIGGIVALFVAERGGLGAFFAIILFFLVGESVTRFVRGKYRQKEHGTRSTVNIIGNVGPALLALIINPVPFSVGYFASLASAFADTLSSEIGGMSKDPPLLITTLKPVTPGTDGGITVLGLVAAAAGGIIFGILGYVLTQDVFWLAALTLAGIMGSVLDSLIGATLQKEGYADNNLT
ncbi:MAG: DUF92 domain-containing protein, partial [archaeon]|nr:DUF92 domain-containing protein [archaeon]